MEFHISPKNIFIDWINITFVLKHEKKFNCNNFTPYVKKNLKIIIIFSFMVKRFTKLKMMELKLRNLEFKQKN